MLASDRFQLICALTLALLCCNVNAQQQVNLNNICLLLPNGQMITNTNSCQGYYLCMNGVATVQSCQTGFYFSKDLQSCMPASQVTCGASTTDNACKGYSVGTWAPVVGSCTGYYYCSASGPQRSNCGDGQNFNPTAQRCQYASTYPCGETHPGGDEPGTAVTTINLCTYIKNGIYFGSAGACQGWNVCRNNLLTPGNCATPLVFNVAKSTCDYKTNTNCIQVTHDPQLTSVSPTYGGPCSSYGETKAATACNQYYLCNGDSFNLQQCAGGQFWDTRTSTCANRLNALNNCDRCIGSKKPFVNAPSSTSCNGYLYCAAGVQQSQGICAAGSYFNEIVGACEVNLQPKFGCCNPNWNNNAPASTKAPGTGATSSDETTVTGSTVSVSGATGTTKSSGDTTATEKPTTT